MVPLKDLRLDLLHGYSQISSIDFDETFTPIKNLLLHGSILLMLIYVGDIVVTGLNIDLIILLIFKIGSKFSLNDLSDFT